MVLTLAQMYLDQLDLGLGFGVSRDRRGKCAGKNQDTASGG